MSHAARLVLLNLFIALSTTVAVAAAQWPQFRGPNGSGVAANERPPVEFGPNKHRLWKTALPSGHSSPCIWGDRIFLTAFENGKLETICLRRRNGKILWKQIAPAEQIEKVHPFSSPAAPTPAADKDRVYVYFGSYGLLSYRHDGKEVWKLPLPTPQNQYGTGTSPILSGENVILVSDSNARNSYLLAVNRKTGETVWKKDRPLFGAGWSTPMVWQHDGMEEIVVLGMGRLMAYDAKDGSERWSVGGFAFPIAVPVAGNGLLFACTSMPGGDPDNPIEIPNWEALKEFDRNGDGKVTKQEGAGFGIHLRKELPREAPGNLLTFDMFFTFADQNKDGGINQQEWNNMLALSKQMMRFEDALMAIRPGGTGDVTQTHVVWKERRGIPEMPSPVNYQDRIYLIRDGGIISCLDASTGRRLYRERFEVPGQYSASPIAANGHIYAASVNGIIAVFRAGDKLEVVARNDLGERIIPTPAIADNKLYVRTEKHLMAFGK